MSNYGYPITIVYRAKHTFKSNVTALFLKYKYYNTLNIILFVTVLTLLKKISTVDLKMCEEYIDFLKQIASLELTALEDRIRDVASIVQGHPVMDRSFFLGESIEPQESSSALTQALLPQPHGAADGNVGLFPGPCQRVVSYMSGSVYRSDSPHASLHWPFHPQPAGRSEDQQGFSGCAVDGWSLRCAPAAPTRCTAQMEGYACLITTMPGVGRIMSASERYMLVLAISRRQHLYRGNQVKVRWSE